MHAIPYWLHIVMGGIGLLTGATSLVATKGSRVHRLAGRGFVVSMLLMSSTGAGLAWSDTDPLSIVAGVLTFYLVFTAWRTLAERDVPRAPIDAFAMVAGASVALAALIYGRQAVLGTLVTSSDLPPPPFFVFGAIALLAVIGDVRLFVGPAVRGVPRLRRHLWRMGVAMLIATASFFLGQPQAIPAPIRITPLLVTPVLLVLLTIPYWLVRTRRI